ncbi:MAG: hypothetical protein H0U45_00255 [Tatlockia sp.]|jgi:phosphotriesterase-related protein|nr:hypothetical protein [Tatlockia sp.]
MRFIRTILGDISPDQLGVTDCHNHLFIRDGRAVERYPDFLLDNYDYIRKDIDEFHHLGGEAVVEMSPIDWGRDIDSLLRLADETGLKIISATGFHKLAYYQPTYHWVYSYDEDIILQLILDELQEGIDSNNYSGPVIKRSRAKAGVIKVGTQTGEFSEIEKKIMRAAARAHSITGAPILTHTDEGALALEQVKFLTEAGVPAHCIGLSHMDRRLDFKYHQEVASTGVFLEYDALTRIKDNFHQTTLDLILKMTESGFAGNILLGSDISRQGYWKSYGGKPGVSFLINDYRRLMQEAGLSVEQVNQFYIDNPRRFLTWAK